MLVLCPKAGPLCVKQTQKTKSELLPQRAYNLGGEEQMDRKKWKNAMRFYGSTQKVMVRQCELSKHHL